MTAKQVMEKYRVSAQELLHTRARSHGTTMHSDNSDIEQLPAATRSPVAHVESFSDKTHNRAMTLFFMFLSEGLS